MPPAAAVAVAAVDPSLEAAFQASCEAVAGLSVAVLDEKQAERDWHRWMQALMDVVATRPMFRAELEYTGALTAVAALNPAQLASNDLSAVLAAGPTLRQRRQLALRALINNSLLEGGEARKLMTDCVFASGVIGAGIRVPCPVRALLCTHPPKFGTSLWRTYGRTPVSQSVSQLFHGPAPRSPLHRLSIRLHCSRSNSSTCTEYSLPGAT